ncbi:hypothetical protein MHU86_3644 [Fragilaria crotonensis]|nr:hypothetical protein MHU86_3644 [Fragilaria crotonensis]
MNGRLFARFLICCSVSSVGLGRTVPDASSTLLRMHKLYQQHPPHDTTLYDALEVAPNATSAQISRSYRVLSRRYHPDKSSGREEKLRAVQHAYNILKEDSSRLPYHQYGLTEVSDAAFLLTGARSPKQMSANQEKLLRLMGYLPDKKLAYDERILFLAANLVERMRPLVEDTISPSAMTDSIAQECAILKKLPLGAQILRCIGRAYRRAGQQVLRQERFKLAGEITNALQSYKHKTLHFLEAVVVGGRLIMTEKKLEGRKPTPINAVDAQARLNFHFLEDEDIDDNAIEEEEFERPGKRSLNRSRSRRCGRSVRSILTAPLAMLVITFWMENTSSFQAMPPQMGWLGLKEEMVGYLPEGGQSVLQLAALELH